MLAEETPSKTHEVAVQILDRVARPVMQSLADEKLREPPLRTGEGDRESYTHFEAFGRTLPRMALWLALGLDETRITENVSSASLRNGL